MGRRSKRYYPGVIVTLQTCYLQRSTVEKHMHTLSGIGEYEPNDAFLLLSYNKTVDHVTLFNNKTSRIEVVAASMLAISDCKVINVRCPNKFFTKYFLL